MKGMCCLLVGWMFWSCSPDMEKLKESFPIEAKPGSLSVEAGGTIILTVDNRSSEAVTYQWQAREDCGRLELDENRPFQAQYVGREADSICSDTVVLVVQGPWKEPITLERRITIRAADKPKELELRPRPIPENWLMINDFNGTLKPRLFECVRMRRGQEQEVSAEVKLNNLEATFSAWSFESAGCTLESRFDGGEEVMALSYDVATDDSYCGYIENLRMQGCDTRSFDLTPFESITFLARSGDHHDHNVYIEIVQWERFADFNQGKAAESEAILVTPEWKRFEIPIQSICYEGTRRRPIVDPSFVKSIGVKLTREGDTDQGVVLLDNLALIRKQNDK